MSASVFSGLLVVLLGGGGALAFSKSRVAAAVFAAFVVTLYLVLPASAFAVLGSILGLIILGTPLFVTLAVITVVCLYFLSSDYQSIENYQLIAEKIFGLTDKSVLLAIPFFVVAGSVMTGGGIARKIVDFADALIGWLPGGLGAAAVLSCMFFAAISGSSPVTVIAIGTIMMPALVQKGYPENFSMGLVTSAGSLGILIPPSIPMIVYAIVVGGSMQVDVADLFIAGIGPGLVIGGILIGYSIFVGIRRPDFSWSELSPPRMGLVARRFLDGFWALLLPVIVLGGIYPVFGPSGLFTPTEAAAVAVVYAFAVEMFIHRELSWSQVPKILWESAVLMGSLLGILVISFAFNHFLVEEQVVDMAAEYMTQLDLGYLGFLVLLNLFLLAIGCLMDILSAILIVAPLVAPIAAQFGIDPIHLGIIFVVNLEIGYLTPPIGMNLFVSSTLFDRPVGRVIRAVTPFTALMLCGLMLITWYEPIAGGLPRLMSGGSWATPAKVVALPSDDDDDDDDDDAAPSGIEALMKEAGVTADQEKEAEPTSIEALMKKAGVTADQDAEEDEADEDAADDAQGEDRAEGD